MTNLETLATTMTDTELRETRDRFLDSWLRTRVERAERIAASLTAIIVARETAAAERNS